MAIRVLVVDDDPWILRMVTATLEKRGFVVDTARDGKLALAKATAQPPDVLITDVMMPGMDGYALVSQMRSYPHLAMLPVILLTALGKDESRLRSLGLSPDCYLAKPFRFDELEKRVSAAVAGSAGSGVWAMPESGVHAMPVAPGSGVHPMPSPYPPTAYPGYPPPPYPYPPQPAYGQPGYPYPAYPGYPPAPAAPEAAPAPAAPAPAPASAPAPSNAASTTEAGVPTPVTTTGSSARDLRRPPTGETATPGSQRTTALNGRLEQLGLSSLLVMMEMERKDGVLSLKNGDGGIVGRIFLRAGQVVSAKLDGLKALGGRECVYEMLSWTSGTFSFSATKVDMQDTVQSSTTHLLMEGARLIDEANRE